MAEDAEEVDKNYFRPSTVVKWSDLQQALQNAQGTRIMFVDTCHSGGAHNPRLIKDAADAKIVVFSATDSATLAQEDPDLGHGLFTYALVEGLNGKPPVFIDEGAVNIQELISFVSREVKRLSKGEQKPTLYASGRAGFRRGEAVAEISVRFFRTLLQHSLLNGPSRHLMMTWPGGCFRGIVLQNSAAFCRWAGFERWSTCGVLHRASNGVIGTHAWQTGYAAQVTAADGGGRQRNLTRRRRF